MHGGLGLVLVHIFTVGLFLLVQSPVICAAERAPGLKNVLFISSYHPGFPTFYQQLDGIRAVFDPFGIHLDIEFMDSKRFDPSEIEPLFHKSITYKLSRLQPYDLILVGDDNALHYALDHQHDLIKDVPVVFLGVDNRQLALRQNKNPRVTGVVESVSMGETLELVTQLQPNVRRIVVISDGTVSAHDYLSGFYAEAWRFPSVGFSHFSLNQLSFDELAEKLRLLDPGDAVILVSAFMDRTGKRVSFDTGLNLILDSSNAPLYHLWYKGMGKGIIGGKLTSHYEQGRVAAEMAVKVLHGTPVGSIPVVAQSPSHFLVDPKAMEAKGLSLSRIPSEVARFKERAEAMGWYRLYAKVVIVAVAFLGLIVFVMVVTAFHRRRANAQVARSEQRFRKLTRHMEEVFCVVSLESRQIEEISPAIEVITGLSPATLYRDASLLMNAILDPDRELFTIYLGLIRSGGEHMDAIEFRIRDTRGGVHWIRFRGFGIEDPDVKALKIAGMATDITDAKQEDLAMKALVETLAGRVEQDFFDGAVRHICAFLGCDTVIIGEVDGGTKVQTLAMVQDNCMMPNMSYDLVGTPCFETLYEGVCIYPEGVQVHFPESDMLSQVGAEGYLGFPLRNHTGAVIGVMCAFSRKRFSIPKRTQEVVAILAKGIANEMERLESEKEKKEMEVSLIRSQKMEAIGTLAGGIAHDFNNILFPIMGYVQMMLEDVSQESPHGGYLRKIHASSLRAKKLVDQILAFSRRGDTAFSPVSLSDVLTEVMDLVRSSLPSTIELQADIPDCTPLVMGDATQIHQVVMNLVTNAYHAMEKKGGCISVKLEPLDEVSPAQEGKDWLVLTVRDTGHGIDPDTSECIFDPYFTTKSKDKGTGLGLAVVLGIVKSHGGDIGVDSTPAVGTVFTVSFPCITGATGLRDVVEPPPMPRGNGHVLVVDDEEEVCLVEKMMLERLGYHVSMAGSGTEALTFFDDGAPRVDLILSDMTMPSMTGVEFVERVREAGHDLPILLCTGLKDAAQERVAQGLGILGIVKKPVSMGELADQVHMALGSHRG